MSIPTNIPQIAELIDHIETQYGKKPAVHADFLAMTDDIYVKLKEHISETTLERLWQYSTRCYSSVSLHTLDLLCRFIDVGSWENFCKELKLKSGVESDFFDEESISVKQLKPGERIKIGWQPDPICILKYLGNCKFIVEESLNAKIHDGDTFTCHSFQLHQPLYLDDFRRADVSEPSQSHYVAGSLNGLTLLQLL